MQDSDVVITFVLIGGLSGIMFIVAHIGFSLVVSRAVSQRKPLFYVAAARCTSSMTVSRIGQVFSCGWHETRAAGRWRYQKLRSSSGAVVVASESDDKTAWVRTGQVYERMALTMTSLNIKSAFLNQPIEVAAVRAQFQTAVGLETALPQLLVRFGYADAMPRSLRRPVEQVIM